jgi:adenine-specific DNA-methyltransferase
MSEGNPVTHTQTDPVTHTSADLLAEQIARLKAIFPEAFTEGKIDFDKLRATLGDSIDDRPQRYSFTWAGKDEAIRILQMPTRATLVPCPQESINWDTTRHLFIEGDNLEVLKLVLRPYYGQVKMIYIDPPYNTGNDFVYPDNYADPLETYLRLTSQSDEAGNLLSSNPETSGRYHSAWLSMMYPRLFLARQLLREDGVIFVSIDDNEAHDLRMLMNEAFGEESFLACFIWNRRQMADSRNQDRASTDHEYVLSYRNPRAVLRGKDIDIGKYSNPDNDPRGPWFSADITGLANRERRPNLHYDVTNPKTGLVYPPSPTRGWLVSKETFLKYIEEDRILWPSKPDGRPRLKKFLKEVTNFQTGFSSMLDVGFTTEGTREIQELFGEKIIQFPKPVSLARVLAQQGTSANDGDLILDFFAGSCTTAQAILELNREDGGNRHFIMVQLPEPTGNPQYPTIADIGKERIRRVIARMQQERAGQLDLQDRDTPEDLGFKVWKLAPSNLRPWTGVAETQPEAYAEQIALFTDPLAEGWTPENVIAEVALKEAGFGLDYYLETVSATSSQTVYRVTDPDKNQAFYICLDSELRLNNLKPLELTRDRLFVCRAKALDDETAANLSLQCRLKTI